MTECTQPSFTFAEHGRRQVVARFDGGTITSDGGGVLLRQLEQRSGIVRQFAACFRDHRQPAQVEHSVRELVSQRVYGLVLGYEDLNDHDQLRSDPLLALLSGKQDLAGKQRRRAQDRGNPGAGKSTLNRLEGTPADADSSSRYKKIVLDTGAVDRLLTDLYIQSQPRQPKRIVLDLDATTTACTAIRKGAFSTATTGIIATCRSTFSPGSSCCARACGRPISTPRRGRWKKSSASSNNCGGCGPKPRSCCGPTAVFAATRS